MDDLLKDYPAFQQYSRNGLELELQFQKAEKLPENVLDWAFTLCKSNMEEIYNGAWGWNDNTKREELSASEARFLIAYTEVELPLFPMNQQSCSFCYRQAHQTLIARLLSCILAWQLHSLGSPTLTEHMLGIAVMVWAENCYIQCLDIETAFASP